MCLCKEHLPEAPAQRSVAAAGPPLEGTGFASTSLLVLSWPKLMQKVPISLQSEAPMRLCEGLPEAPTERSVAAAAGDGCCQDFVAGTLMARTRHKRAAAFVYKMSVHAWRLTASAWGA